MMNKVSSPLVLCILDGWGMNPEPDSNAIFHANTPNWDLWLDENVWVSLHASGQAVGLPEGQMGNSEVGHMHLGSGRIVPQDLTRIDQAIADHRLADCVALASLCEYLKTNQKKLHLVGLVSAGGVHAHQRHWFGLLDFLAEHGCLDQVLVHACTDGRDTPPRSAYDDLDQIATYLQKKQLGQLATLVGRYYALDRDLRWERTDLAYQAIVNAEAPYQAETPLDGLAAAYERGESDEFIKPTVIGEPIRFAPGDVMLMMHYRPDRMRQLARCFFSDPTVPIDTRLLHYGHLISLTRYQTGWPVEVCFPPTTLDDTLGEVVANQGLRQLRVAESEKYPHVSYFFNGGREATYPGEDRVLIPSPKVATYDLQPEMHLNQVVQVIVQAIEQKSHQLIICNMANPDMVGHTGNWEATIKAVEAVDQALGEIDMALEKVSGQLLVTADHGNCEHMLDIQNNQPHTAHTCYPVPLLYRGAKQVRVAFPFGSLADVAPTVLALMGFSPPAAMTGRVLLVPKQTR